MPIDVTNHFWDKNGNEIDLLTWGRLFEDMEYRLVGEEFVETSTKVFQVTTVWFGDAFEDMMLDELFPEGPRIFGTLIWDSTVGRREFRHSTLAQAEDRHRRIVEALRAGDYEYINDLWEETGA